MNQIQKALSQIVQLHEKGQLQEAELLCRKVLEIEPNQPDVIHFLGVIAYNVGKYKIAKDYISRAIELSPDHSGCYTNMGNISQAEMNYREAEKWYRKAIEKSPGSAKAYNNLGVSLTKQNRLEESVQAFHAALKIDSNYVEAHANLGESYKLQGEWDKALDCCRHAIDLSPKDIQANWNRSILWLLKGELAKGFQAYEWRWERPSTPKRKIQTGEKWLGQPITGKTLFVYEEQGLGDTIQFIRFLPELRRIGIVVIFEALPALIRLLENFIGYSRLWVGIKNQDTRPSDRFDYHVSLLSLPAVLGTTLETIPSATPYLFADRYLSGIWKNRIGEEKDGLKIGVVWAGNPGHNNDRNRSIHLSRFANIAEIKGVRLFCLQKDKHAKWTDMDSGGIFERDLGKEVSDFADTAAIIENLDLVISVDTAVVHLAGALGKEVWTLLPFSPDWRWLLDREDSPWYPTMRLFRQPAPGDWDSVFEKVMERLKKKVME